VSELLLFNPAELYITGFDFYVGEKYADEAYNLGKPTNEVCHDLGEARRWLAGLARRDDRLTLDDTLRRICGLGKFPSCG
jgi:hypothetical protein